MIAMLTITRPPSIAHEVDDDLPNVPPDCSPLDSAQARRAMRLPGVIEPLIPHRSGMLNSGPGRGCHAIPGP